MSRATHLIGKNKYTACGIRAHFSTASINIVSCANCKRTKAFTERSNTIEEKPILLQEIPSKTSPFITLLGPTIIIFSILLVIIGLVLK